MDKQVLRQTFLEKRQSLTEQERTHHHQHINTLLKEHLKAHQIIAGYWPIKGEVDITPFLEDYKGIIALPDINTLSEPMVFRTWNQQQDSLQTGQWHIPYSPDGMVVEPDIILVPLVAVDQQGIRLGYGGGYYDRTIKPHHHPIGIAYHMQFTHDPLPHASHDKRLHEVITECGVYNTAS